MAENAGRPLDWAGYYDTTGARPPRETLLFALEKFAVEAPAGSGAGQRLAVDLGCGSGRDTVELLRRGWRVVAFDAEPSAIDKLVAREDLPPGGAALLTARVARFADAIWPRCDLVNSSFALPLAAPAEFPALWRRIAGSLEPGGRIACQLYGPRDSWSARPGMTFHARAAIDALLADFDVEMLREEETDSTTPRGAAKHWHIFHIVARKAGELA